MSESNPNAKLCSDAVFRSVFDTNFKVLRNFLVYKFRGDIETAEDVAQNAFVKLWENCSLLKPEQAKSFYTPQPSDFRLIT
ncbi:sigma factor [Flavobacterium phycosphaerae]|uniref:sigma factor n=1 Tax=Flavobacterium phycosphaerae TaxID=2697515 RepID=UPI001F3D921F|nr:sigma factor [Flavobacterium phycosphaerae]